MRVLFWGTPEFATAPLRALIGEGFDVVGVVTQPDKPVGRSRSKLQESPVKKVALAESIPVLQPDKPRGDAFIAEVAALSADISIVVAYGHILPRIVIDLPRLGTLNIHASLLPALRGAAPIQAAIREGLAETGVSIMQMVPALDAGPVLHTARTPILEDETALELSLRLSELGANALIEALALVELGLAQPVPQDDSRATFAPKITRESAQVNWTASAYEVSRHIRAYDPKPGAWSKVNGGDVKLYGARVAPRGTMHAPGDVIKVDSAGLLVACGAGAVRIATVQPSGKTRLTAEQWANGRGIAAADTFDTGATELP
ncbi:MAG: methionyl-tRNA formyltransferase [bacterium]